jgi:hypothetical protein
MRKDLFITTMEVKLLSGIIIIRVAEPRLEAGKMNRSQALNIEPKPKDVAKNS